MVILQEILFNIVYTACFDKLNLYISVISGNINVRFDKIQAIIDYTAGPVNS